MTIQTYQNTNPFNDVPTDILTYVTSKLSGKDLLIFRAACMGFKTLLDYLGKEHRIWESFFPHCFVFHPACGQAAAALSEAISNGSDANEVHAGVLKDMKKFDRKLAKFFHVFESKLKRERIACLRAEVGCDWMKIPIAKAAKKLEEAFKDCLRAMNMSPSGKMKPSDSIKFQRSFTFLYRWLQKLNEVENNGSPAQQSYIKETVDMIYSNTMKSIYSWMIDEFVNSKEPKTSESYKFMRQLLGNKNLDELYQKLLEGNGGSFEMLNL